MRKLIFIFAILLICVSWLTWTYRVRVTNEALSRGLGVPVQVQDVEISTHGLVLRGLSMGPSEDPKVSPAIFVDSIRAIFSPWQLWQNPAHISELDVDGVYFTLDVTSMQGMAKNWTKLLDRLAGKDKQNSEKATESDSDPRKYIIDYVLVTNVYAAIQKGGQSGYREATPALARLELHDVGSGSPHTLAQTTQLVLKAIMEQAIALNPQFNGVVDSLLRNADVELKKALKTVKKQFKESGASDSWDKVKGWFDWSK